MHNIRMRSSDEFQSLRCHIERRIAIISMLKIILKSSMIRMMGTGSVYNLSFIIMPPRKRLQL